MNFAAWVMGLVLGGVVAACAQPIGDRELVTVRLVADTSQVAPRASFRLGVLLEMAPGWHTYWQNPGDSGLATKVKWSLPEGFSIGPLQWPLPQRIVEPGDIEVFAYKGRVMLAAEVRAPESLPAGPLEFGVEAEWLVCEKICIPGEGSAKLILETGEQTTPANVELFAETEAMLPDRVPLPYELKWQREGTSTRLTIPGLPTGSNVDFFPLPAQGTEIGHARRDPQHPDTLEIPALPPFRGVLILEKDGQRQGWTVEAEEGGASEEERSAGPPSTVASPESPGLALALVYGFLGGLILNLMPCVLPVISLKIFGFLRQAGEDRWKIFLHGLAFTAGIFVWFLGLAIVVGVLKAGGTQATWAFQFQNAWFNLAICAIVFVFALNLFGVFEITLPGRAATALDEAGGGSGYGGSFFQGVFATLLATPCTAPFLGTALGFAFSQSVPVIFGMFAAVAAGMASPYILLSARPGWMKYLPRPGVWMERVKQFMGFPLMATLLWLLWILGNQKGIEAVIWAGAFLLCLALAVWFYGSFCGPATSPRTRVVALAAALVIMLGGGWVFAGVLFASSTRASTVESAGSEGISWKPFSKAGLEELLRQGHGVFLDFTAEWCITCKFNERTAIDRPAVRAKFEQTGIVPMKADWTNPNPEIADALREFGRVGVPFYVIYPPGRPEEPIVLPELLTEAILLDALDRATGKAR